MKKIISTIASALILIMSAEAQISVLQDAAGETSIQTTNNQFVLNAQETSVSLAFGPQNYQHDDRLYWKINASVNGKKKAAAVLKSGDFKLNGSLGVTFIGELLNGSDYATWVAGYSMELSRFKLYDRLEEFDDQIYNDSNLGHKVFVGANFESMPFFNMIGGISFSGGWRDNTSTFDPLQIETINRITYNADSSQILSVNKSTDDAYDVSAFKPNQQFARINIDLGNDILNNRILLMSHFRFAFDESRRPTFNPGFGIYLARDGAPLEAVAGIQIQTNDWLNNRGSEDSRWERTSINIVAGFKLD